MSGGHSEQQLVPEGPFGLIAKFDSPDDLLRATREAYAAGYRNMDAYTPVPVHHLEEALGQKFTMLPSIVFVGGLSGALFGFGLQAWTSVIDYPINIGGRPLLSWPAFIPVTFECTILFAAFATVFGMFALNGLPRPHHPVFGAKDFDQVSVDKFFLCIEADDPKFHIADTRRFLESLGPEEVTEVAH